MGKINDALKKVNVERSKEKQILKKQSELETYKDNISGEFKLFDNDTSTTETNKKEQNRSKCKIFNISKTNDSSGIDPRVVAYYDYTSHISEQYRMLRSNIKAYFKSKAKTTKISMGKPSSGPKIFTISSGLKGEGKTVTSINLAIALAKDLNTKVLLIDADIRNGIVHKLLNINNKPGLSDILTNKYDYSVGVHPTQIRNLYVIPRGELVEQPSELLGSRKMNIVLEQIKNESLDYVIIDTPPVVSFTDATIIGAKTSGMLFVVQAQKTQVQIIKRAKDVMNRTHTKLLGFVLTQSEDCIEHFYGYYNYYRDRKQN